MVASGPFDRLPSLARCFLDHGPGQVAAADAKVLLRGFLQTITVNQLVSHLLHVWAAATGTYRGPVNQPGVGLVIDHCCACAGT